MSLILRRALDLPAEIDDPEARDGGWSLEQIKEIAAEVGIDSSRIELAASSLPALSQSPPNPYAGIPTTIQLETLLRGLQIVDVPKHDYLGLIRRTMGRHGIVEERSGSIDWKARDALGGRYVSLESTSDGTRLRLLGNFRDGLFVFLATVGMASFVGLSLLLDGLGVGSGLTVIGAALPSLIPPRIAYRWWRKREDATMASLHRNLIQLLTASETSNGQPDPDSGEGEDEGMRG